MPSDIILIMLYEIPCKMSLGLNHHFLTTSQNVEQHLRSQSLISYSAFRLFRSTVVSSSFHIVANVFGLGVRAGFGAQNCQPALHLNRSTKLQVCTSPRLTQNPCVCCATNIQR